MKKLVFVLGVVAIGIGASEVSAQGYRPGMLGVDTNLRRPQMPPPSYTPPAPTRVPSYTPPPRAPAPPPRPVDLRPPSVVNPPAPNPNTVRTLPPLPPAPPPPRFEGGAIAVPTPTGGAAGSAVLRDNKKDINIDVHTRTEPGGYEVKGGISAPLPESKK